MKIDGVERLIVIDYLKSGPKTKRVLVVAKTKGFSRSRGGRSERRAESRSAVDTDKCDTAKPDAPQ